MFEPNSIRSLIKKRNMSRLNIQAQNSTQQSTAFSKTCTNFNQGFKNTDPDLQTILQAKLMIKQIDHDVDKIRLWRQSQKLLLQQRLKSNLNLFTQQNQQYQKHSEQISQLQTYQNKKLIQKMKIQQNKYKRQNNSSTNQNSQTLESSQAGQLQYQDWEINLYDSELMGQITNSQNKIDQKKHMKNQDGQALEDKHIAFLHSIHQLSNSDIFTKKNNDQHNQSSNKQIKNQPLNKTLLQQELDDIDRELREMEELLNQ